MMKKTLNCYYFTLTVLLLSILTNTLVAEEQIYTQLPVREVTLFKDGHAFLLHQGQMDTNSEGNVVLDYLPNPVLGTFWAYTDQPENTLSCVVASAQNIKTGIINIESLIQNNQNKIAEIKEKKKERSYLGKVIKVTNEYRINWSPESNSSFIYDESKASKTVLIQKDNETFSIPLDQIESISFLADSNTLGIQSVTRNQMTLKLNWKNNKPRPKSNVGIAYVQKGIRWIPNYRIDISDNGNATVKLQASIINELTDLENVTAHLVVGVPRFVFKDTPDPISLQNTLNQLSGHFNPASGMGGSFSNSIRSQARHSERMDFERTEEQSLPVFDQGQGQEDLFVFAVNNLTLKKGERMILPLVEFSVPYENFYTVDLPFVPPLELRRNFNTNQHLELAKLLNAPKAMHVISLSNTSEFPLTTAPAMIFKDNKILAQGMMKYTPVGAKGNLEVTHAVGIDVILTDEQIKQTSNDIKINNQNFSKIEMLGKIKIKNFTSKSAKIRINRSIMGNMDQASNDAEVTQLGHGYNGLLMNDDLPFWWNWCSWPWWWYRLNSIGQTQWIIELEPNQNTELTYNWHYYWE